MKKLVLHVRREYFYQIKCGTKLFEFREMTPYWGKRIRKNDYEAVEIVLGYAKKDDADIVC